MYVTLGKTLWVIGWYHRMYNATDEVVVTEFNCVLSIEIEKHIELTRYTVTRSSAVQY